jgi:exodeoxyribonuclease VIII
VTPADFLPGVHPDLPAETYHAVEALSASGIKKLLRSPAHYILERTQAKPPTEAMRIGTAVHTLLLEPHRAAEIVEMPTFNSRSKDGKAERQAWLEANEGVQAFDSETFERVHRAAEAARVHPAAAALLSEGRSEVSLMWSDAALGVPCKARVDWLRDDGAMVDVKTTQDASADGFSKAIGAFQYHAQAAWYFHGAEHLLGATPTFWAFVAVETEPPFAVATYVLDAASIRAGMTLCSRALRVYAECLQSGQWPGYSEEVQPISAPRWSLRGEF